MLKAAPRVLALALVVVLAAVALRGVLPDLNPFGTETEDRSPPALLQSLQRMSEYRAATANLQQIVDVEEDANLLPGFIKGERTVIVAAGDVDAAVDFRRLGAGALRVSDDRRSVAITLPAAHLTPARLDLDRTRVVSRQRGVLDRVGDAVGSGNRDDERELLALAQDKLDAAAREDPRLLRTAEANTRSMLRRLAEGLGYERVTVRFRPAPAV